MSRDDVWQEIFDHYKMARHNFGTSAFHLKSEEIKKVSSHYPTTSEREVRVLCKQDTRESRPAVFKSRGLFLLPTSNRSYAIVKGEGYVDIPPIERTIEIYQSKLDYVLDTAHVGNSEMQHIDFAYASSLVRTAMQDDSLVLTIRGRKYTPSFNFNVSKCHVEVHGVQTEVDAGYEGRDKVILVEAKGAGATNTIIRQLFYPYRQWQQATQKEIVTLFFAKSGNQYSLWRFKFQDPQDYNSIKLVESHSFVIRSEKR